MEILYNNNNFKFIFSKFSKLIIKKRKFLKNSLFFIHYIFLCIFNQDIIFFTASISFFNYSLEGSSPRASSKSDLAL